MKRFLIIENGLIILLLICFLIILIVEKIRKKKDCTYRSKVIDKSFIAVYVGLNIVQIVISCIFKNSPEIVALFKLGFIIIFAAWLVIGVIANIQKTDV